jgi:hypothetical protein
MSNHICHIPDLKTLIDQYDALGLERFVARYKKCEAIIGDSDAILYVERMCRLLKEINSK